MTLFTREDRNKHLSFRQRYQTLLVSIRCEDPLLHDQVRGGGILLLLWEALSHSRCNRRRYATNDAVVYVHKSLLRERIMISYAQTALGSELQGWHIALKVTTGQRMKCYFVVCRRRRVVVEGHTNVVVVGRLEVVDSCFATTTEREKQRAKSATVCMDVFKHIHLIISNVGGMTIVVDDIGMSEKAYHWNLKNDTHCSIYTLRTSC